MAAQRWTSARRRALEEYVADLAPRLRLGDWRIQVSWDVAPDLPTEATLAEMAHSPRAKHATLRLGATFLELSAAEQTQTLCHELVHCHFYPVTDLVSATFSLLEAGERRVAELALEHQVEHAVDDLADAFAPHVPPFVVDAPAPRRKRP